LRFAQATIQTARLENRVPEDPGEQMETVERRGAMSHRARRPAAMVCIALVGAAACSSNKSKSAEPAPATTTTPPLAAGPTADMSHEIGRAALSDFAQPSRMAT
jgi:hypothetical protein